jgi:hypothetical protein
MSYPIRDCECEDFPLCIHADNFDTEPEFCDICGWEHRGSCPPDDDSYEEDEDA